MKQVFLGLLDIKIIINNIDYVEINLVGMVHSVVSLVACLFSRRELESTLFGLTLMFFIIMSVALSLC